MKVKLKIILITLLTVIQSASYSIVFTTTQAGGNSSKDLTVQAGKQYQLKFDLQHQTTSAVRIQVIENYVTIVDVSNLTDGIHSFSFTSTSNAVTLKFIREDAGNVSRDFEVDNLVYEEISQVVQTESNHEVGRKEYEITDHLGNVRIVISDNIIYGNTEVVSATDYLPFGMVARNHSNGSEIRYGYQNQEKINEFRDNGNYLDFKYRGCDPRVGRFFSVDPLLKKYPWNSPYAFSENRVIDGIELEGLEFTKNLDRKKVQDRVNTLKMFPTAIYQGGAGTCAVAAVTYLWIKRDKEGFAKAAMDLYDKGEVKVNEYSIDPDSHLEEMDPKNNKDIYSGLGETFQADWMILSSIQDSQNTFYDFDGVSSDKQGAGNTSSDIADMMTKLVGYNHVVEHTFKMGGGQTADIAVMNAMSKITELNNNGADQVLIIDAKYIVGQGGKPDQIHAVTYLGNYKTETVNGVLYHTFDVQTWGGVKQVRGTNEEMAKCLRGEVYGYDDKKAQ